MDCTRRPGIGHLLKSFSLFILIAGSASGVELVLPENSFYYNPVASVWNQASVWINPAAIGASQPGQMFIFTHRDNRFLRDWALASTLKTAGMAYRHVAGTGDDDLDEWVVALGGGRKTAFGISYRYIKNGPGYLENRHLWNVGLLTRHHGNLALGLRIENLNRGRINGERSDVRYVFGAATRVYRDLVTLTFDVDMTSKESLEKADFRTGVEVRPTPGLYLFVDFDNHSRFNLGVRLNFDRAFAGHYHSFDRNGKTLSSTSYVGTTKTRQPSLIKAKPKTLYTQLSGTLPENPPIPRFRKRPLHFFDYVDGVYRAAEDDEINRMFIRIGSLRCGMAKVEELSQAIRYFRSQNKKVIAYLSQPTNLTYLLACSADSVIIPPVSQLSLIGLRAELRTYKGLMDKFGIEAEIERVAEYKTAPEQWINERPSDLYRQEINRLLDVLYDELVQAVAQARALPADSVKFLIDRAPLTSTEAIDVGLVDETRYLDDAIDRYTGPSGLIGGGRVAFRDYLDRSTYTDRWGQEARVALVIAEGDITGGSSAGLAGGRDMLGAIKRARSDHNVKGVVFRVNSPGGSAMASDLIRHEIDKTAEKKPLVISMGDVAASGGYYISSVPGRIFVNRSTITGSIGVYAGKVNLSGFFNKAGIYSEMHQRGGNADVFHFTESYTPEQRNRLKSRLRLFYNHFVNLVAEARALEVDSIEALARGKTWTGLEAVEYGLADQYGGIYASLEDLCQETGLSRDQVEIVVYPQEYYLFKNPFDVSGFWKRLYRWIFADEPGSLVLNEDETEHIFFRMPYNVDIR